MVGAKYFALIFVDPSETEILLADREGVKKTMTINELLPNAFKEF